MEKHPTFDLLKEEKVLPQAVATAIALTYRIEEFEKLSQGSKHRIETKAKRLLSRMRAESVGAVNGIDDIDVALRMMFQ